MDEGLHELGVRFSINNISQELYGLTELQKPETRKSRIRYTNRLQPFIKIRTNSSIFPIDHEGYKRQTVGPTFYPTGSNFFGSVDKLGFAGYGTYKYPHGVVYKGNFLDGEFHGTGVLIYPKGQRLEGTWRHGKLVESVFITGDNCNIVFKEDFLQFPVRVHEDEVDENMTVLCTEKQLSQPKHEIPEGCYDTIDGYFDPYTFVIYSYDGKLKRVATNQEGLLILSKYRQKASFVVGYLPELYEFWTSGRQSEVREIKKFFEMQKKKEAGTENVEKEEEEEKEEEVHTGA
ncbi:unnamed protein product [Phyllotreta striolata]|uniref:MORN repeat-containing protein 5 n=1 Tax=Phyllotreta striolata TaxID=444603 RepID=A0A9N9THI9_PHYSR|nr:unnamed protein product [Phyllotreta striolata]